MKNILITGCAGFIGSNLSERLVNLGWNVIGIDNLMTGKKENISHLDRKNNFKFIWADIRDRDLLDSIIKENNITHISHQAARGSVPKSIEDPILTNDINISGTLNVLWCAKENHAKKVICAISSSVYGDTPTLPKIETMAYDPLSPYALSKVACEIYCKQFYQLYGLKTIGLRYFNVYGKKQDPNGDYAAVIPKWISLAKQDQDLIINGKNDITRDFTFIDDVIDANILALECENDAVFGEGFNIGYSGRTSILDVAKKIIEITNSESKIIIGEGRPGDIQDSYADISKARKLLNFNPKFNIWDGLKQTIKWYC